MRFLLLALIIVAVSAPVAASRPEVALQQGKLAGFEENGISMFRGIPFAGDTGGIHRWRPPSAAPHWRGVRDATHFGPVCPQPSVRHGKAVKWLDGFTMSEDCLNLTVYTPSLHSRRPVPVMVWVHGGGARVGAGSRFDGSRLAARGVVVVTLNYRLGLLGRFANPVLSASQPDMPLGNYGLMDVLAGLKWVKTNIAKFGGDPSQVTLFGQSSGSVAVTALMTSPMSKGLFQRAIAQSGVPLQLGTERYLSRSRPGVPSLERGGEDMAKALLSDAKTVTPADLRGLSWQSIVTYQQSALRPGALMPVIDGKVLVDAVGRRFAQGRQLPIPLMIGTVSWEKSLFANFPLPPINLIARGVPAEQIHAHYPDLKGQALVRQWLADTQFNAAVRWLANANADIDQPTWVYRFDHLSPEAVKGGQPGAAHADEVPYLFEVSGKPGRDLDDETEKRMTALMLGYWTQFARTGNPNGDDLPSWPRWESGDGGVTELLDVPVRRKKNLMGKRMTYQLERFTRMLSAETGR